MSFNWKEILKSLKDEVIPKRWDTQEFVQNFFEGLFLVVPVAVTIYVVFIVFNFIDGWLNIPIPGIGFILTIVMLVLVGRLASNVFFPRGPGFPGKSPDPHALRQTGLHLAQGSHRSVHG